MIELSRHIEALLLEHDCVIVPHLGGFVTQYVSASRVDDEQLFLPPRRTVGFNSQLTLNDGLLVQSYMQAYDTSYPETVRLIEDAVDGLKRTLQEEGRFELKGIGTILLNLDGTYNFCPNEAGVLSPELYGLGSFVQPVVSREKATSVQRPEDELQEDETVQKRHYTVSINRELCNYVAAAVVAVVFYFLWATPLGVPGSGDANGISVAAVPVPTVMKSQPLQIKEVSPVQETTPVEAEKIPEQQKHESASAQSPASDRAEDILQEGYTIVLASSVPRANAERYVGELRENGLPDARVTINKRQMVRVVYGAYADESEAYITLKSLRRGHKDFKEAWIMPLK